MLAFLKGKKTYFVALIAALVAAAQVLGYTIPEGVYEILAALGLVTLRVGVAKTKE